jgi:hypothetical protein
MRAAVTRLTGLTELRARHGKHTARATRSSIRAVQGSVQIPAVSQVRQHVARAELGALAFPGGLGSAAAGR